MLSIVTCVLQDVHVPAPLHPLTPPGREGDQPHTHHPTPDSPSPSHPLLLNQVRAVEALLCQQMVEASQQMREEGELQVCRGVAGWWCGVVFGMVVWYCVWCGAVWWCAGAVWWCDGVVRL